MIIELDAGKIHRKPLIIFDGKFTMGFLSIFFATHPNVLMTTSVVTWSLWSLLRRINDRRLDIDEP